MRDYTLRALHWKIGYVPQKASVFSGTITSNVAYGDRRSENVEEDVRKAVAVAQAKESLEDMVGGYSATIAPGRNERIRRSEAAPPHRPGSGEERTPLYAG